MEKSLDEIETRNIIILYTKQLHDYLWIKQLVKQMLKKFKKRLNISARKRTNNSLNRLKSVIGGSVKKERGTMAVRVWEDKRGTPSANIIKVCSKVGLDKKNCKLGHVRIVSRVVQCREAWGRHRCHYRAKVGQSIANWNSAYRATSTAHFALTEIPVSGHHGHW